MKYLVAYNASISITDGNETIPIYEDKIFADIIELKQNFPINTKLLDAFKQIIINNGKKSIPSEEGYEPEFEITIISVTKFDEE